MSRKEKGGDAQDFSGMPQAAITAADIQQKEFRVSRFGGYKMRDVDEFLDQVTEAMTKLADENQRLRSASGLPAAPAIGAPDLADQSRQADEIIARARAEAAQILQDARAQPAAGASGDPADRAAVGAFLSQEREFLQQLATLVQGHAESVKGMAKATRTPKASAAPAPPAEPVERAVAASAAAGPAGAAEPETEPEPELEPEPAPEPAARTQVDTQPIRVHQPAPASVPGGDRDDEGAEGGDPSLRELFWGED
jgi:DivIVA domain-containing protein